MKDGPRRVLYVDHATALGGAERSLLLLMKRLDRRAWQPHLIAPPGQMAAEASRAGVAVHSLELPRLRRSSRAMLDWRNGATAIAGVARRVGAAFIHSNTVRATAYAALAAGISSLPLVWHMRDLWLSESEPRLKWPDRAGKRFFCSRSTLVLVNSRAVAASLPRSPKISVLHNGIDLSHYAPGGEPEATRPAGNRRPLRREDGPPPRSPVVGMVGRARPLKGHDLFLRMACKLAASTPDCRFLIVGGDTFDVADHYLDRLKSLCSQLGLADRVLWTGHLDDVRPALAAMDVFVNPGAPEGFGLVNIEAMAMGKPVVAFDHGPLPEIVAHDQTGLLAPSGDVDALAAGVHLLLQDPARARRMGLSGRRRAQDLFSIERTVAGLERRYAQLLTRAEAEPGQPPAACDSHGPCVRNPVRED